MPARKAKLTRQRLLLDTNILIDIADENRPENKTSLSLIEYAINNGIAILVSSITVSEYSIKQTLAELPIYEQIQILPFGETEAMETARLYQEYNAYLSGKGSKSKVELKDDLKILSHAFVRHSVITHFATGDKSLASFARESPGHRFMVIEPPHSSTDLPQMFGRLPF